MQHTTMLNILPANGAAVIRSIPELEHEIGEKAGKLLLQIEYWIRIGNNIVDGQAWTYQSTRDIQAKAFPGWSTSTINRTIKKLESLQLIVLGNHNKVKYDKTRWFTLDMAGIARLKSIVLSADGTRSTQNGTRSTQNGTGSTQNGTRSTQNSTGSTQNGTTIPVITTENTTLNTTLNTTAAPAHAADAGQDVPTIRSIMVVKPESPDYKAQREGSDELLMQIPPANLPRPTPPGSARPPLPGDTTAQDSTLDELHGFFTGCDAGQIKTLIEQHGSRKIFETIATVKALPNVDNPPGLVRHLLGMGAGRYSYPARWAANDEAWLGDWKPKRRLYEPAADA